MKTIYGYELTKSEKEVLKLLSEGFSNSEIANSLSVCECTVKAHISHIFVKMGVSNRIQAAIKFIKNKEKFNS